MQTKFDPTNLLTQAITELDCPGALCAIINNGKVTTYSTGSITKEQHNKQYYIYSITKTFTATAILLLCEKQGCFLDKTYASFFPNTTIPKDITIRQMLNHTSGLSDYFSEPQYQQAVNNTPDKPWPHEKLMTIGLKKTPLFQAGKGWQYSNPAYSLLKDLIEKLAGSDFYTYLQHTIIKPLNLTQTKPFLKPDTQHKLLQGNTPEFQSDFRPLYSPKWIATGCLISTATDIAKFYNALFSTKIITQNSLNQMTKTVKVPYPFPPPSIPAYGLGLMHTQNDPLANAYGHGGNGPGYTTYAKHYPNLNGSPFTLSLVLNKTLPTTPFSLADNITRLMISFRQS